MLFVVKTTERWAFRYCKYVSPRPEDLKFIKDNQLLRIIRQKWKLKHIIEGIVSQLDKTNCYSCYRMTMVPKDKNVYYDILKILEKLSKF